LGIKITLPANKNNKTFEPKFLIKKAPINKFQHETENDLYNYWLENTKKDIHKWHHYFPIYYKHFAKYRNKPVNILEIGVFKGGSLRMWKDFFGEKAKIFGVDISPECKKFEDKENGVNIFIGDQSDPNFLEDLMAKVPKIDIFIDDGGHTTSQQITTFLECYDKIADDGIYLCEDLHTNYWIDYIDYKETSLILQKNTLMG
jgi:cephalosporin hydroxylase